MKKTLSLALFLLLNFALTAQDRTTILRDWMKKGSQHCFVVAHRGDWRNAPENSLQGFKNCIDMGVDMVEIDLKMTKDSVLILCHDNTLNRTTTASGKPSDYTFAELRSKHKLKSGHGINTNHDIPTLEEVLLLCKGKILINIDKGYDYFPQVQALMEKTGTTDQVVIKSGHQLNRIRIEKPGVLDKVIFMPIISLTSENAEQMIDEYATIHPVAIECCFDKYTPQVEHLLKKIDDLGICIWLNSLWPSLNAGHDDDLAVEGKRPEEAWGWLLQRGAMLIQTDRPAQLLQYLRWHQRHD